jgi:ABC-2 type transport system ATP-binding protein
VDRATFALHRGEVFGLLGPNGSGKSTTIKMLCGIYPPSAGSIQLAGTDVVASPGAAKERIGYMSQRFSLYPDLTVGENIRFFGAVYGLAPERLRSRANAVVAQAGLDASADTLVRSLSGALRQHVALACAILHEPEILFLDEPTSGVDPAARRSFWRLVDELAANGTTVLVTTHYLREAESCDRMAFIDKGRIVAIDAPDAILARYRAATLEDAFLAAIGAT